MSSAPTISELAAIIADNTAIVNGYLNANNLPTPSFEVDGPAVIPIPSHEASILAAQENVIASTQELHNLMKGPTEMLMGIGVSLNHLIYGVHSKLGALGHQFERCVGPARRLSLQYLLRISFGWGD